MTDSRPRYDPKSDPDLNDEQREEALNRVHAWFAWFRSREDREALKNALPDPLDREAVQDAWAFANDKATNGLLSEHDAALLFRDRGGPEKFEDAGLLARHREGWRLVDYLRLNQTRRQQGRKTAARSAIGQLGGKASGESRKALKEARDARDGKQLLRSPNTSNGVESVSDRSTDTGTGMGTETNEDAFPPPALGDAGACLQSERSAGTGWFHVYPDELKDSAGLERLHLRAAAAGLVDTGDLALFELAAMVQRANRKGDNPAAYLATALQRWRDDPAGFEVVELDRNDALDWLTRANAGRAKRIVQLLWEKCRDEWEGTDEAGVMKLVADAEYQRRMKLIVRTLERERGRKP